MQEKSYIKKIMEIWFFLFINNADKKTMKK